MALSNDVSSTRLQKSNPNEYIWTITDRFLIQKMKSAEPREVFISPTFTCHNFRFYLEIFPNGQSAKKIGNFGIYLVLKALSPKVQCIQIERKYTFVEGNILKEAGRATITKDYMFAKSWSLGTLKTIDIQQFDTFTFKVDIKLHGVFDFDGNDITNTYSQNNERNIKPIISPQNEQINIGKLDSIIMQIETLNVKMDKMEQTLNDIKLRMDEEQKNNDDDRFDKVMNEIKSIKQNMNKLMLNNVDREKEKLKAWLVDKVKLPEYYDVFIDNGIDDILTVSLLTMDTIKGMGIDKIGHQMKILNQVIKLKQNGNNDNNEDGSD